MPSEDGGIPYPVALEVALVECLAAGMHSSPSPPSLRRMVYNGTRCRPPSPQFRRRRRGLPKPAERAANYLSIQTNGRSGQTDTDGLIRLWRATAAWWSA